jgi:hypothetical protein
MKSIAKWAIFLISLKLIILMIDEPLKLLESKQDNGPIIPMYTINIPMDPSIYIMKFIIIFKIILHNIIFVKVIIVGVQKPKFIPKIKCTILLKQLYYMWHNTIPKNAQKGVTIMCFHPKLKTIFVVTITRIIVPFLLS